MNSGHEIFPAGDFQLITRHFPDNFAEQLRGQYDASFLVNIGEDFGGDTQFEIVAADIEGAFFGAEIDALERRHRGTKRNGAGDLADCVGQYFTVAFEFHGKESFLYPVVFKIFFNLFIIFRFSDNCNTFQKIP